ncbi:hypothetical protein ACQEU8_17670 [Streptomyces sp. CA-250714]|uniref:hypothetical protein n=1 Tax=Streptomyces sp. CA-250714 TaxID=3240060 RepID=UPI003D8B4D87
MTVVRRVGPGGAHAGDDDAMDPPPTCPNCPDRLLWKDTRETGPGKEDSWFWFCTGCHQAYVPTPDQKLRFTYAA